MTTMSLNLGSEVSLVCDRILASTGAYVVIPCRSTEDIENYFKNSFAIAKIKKEKAVVWLASSTKNTETYDSAFKVLTDAGVMVYNLGYSKDNLPTTLVYQVNSMPGTTEFIKNQLKATEVTLPPPGVNPNKDKVDIIIVLGQNAPIKPSPVPYIPPPAKISTTTVDSASSTKSTISSTTPSGLKIPTSTTLNLKTKN